MTQWKTQAVKDLAQAFLSIKNQDRMLSFLRDLLTEPEIKEFSGRFAAAKALSEGKSQRAVAKETGVSIATVTRVNQWLLRGMNGYKEVIANMSDKSQHSHHKVE